MSLSFRNAIKKDLSFMLDDEIEYFGKKLKVKVFESLDDPGIASKGAVLMYLVGNEDDFIGVSKNQNVKLDNTDYTITSFRKSPNGGIVVVINKASGR